MKVKVLKAFRDKSSKKLFNIGEEIEVTKKRYEEINSTFHGKLVDEIKITPKKKK